MFADWIGAGKAQGYANTLAWYEENKDKMMLHAATRQWIEAKLYAKVVLGTLDEEGVSGKAEAQGSRVFPIPDGEEYPKV